VLGALAYAEVAVLFPRTGDLPMLAVAPHARRQGLGTRLLNAAATRADKPLRILNVDDRNAEIGAFLEKCGAARYVKQFEMQRRA
jgi:GNAT superfamily N-acetyltransferase